MVTCVICSCKVSFRLSNPLRGDEVCIHTDLYIAITVKMANYVAIQEVCEGNFNILFCFLAPVSRRVSEAPLQFVDVAAN